MQPSGCGQAVRFPVKDYFLMRVVKIAMKSAIEKDTSTDKMKMSDDSSGNLASARKPITALSKK
jgi:hypothetical protein